VLSRVEELTSDLDGNDEYAAYTYLGANTIVTVTHPEVTSGLELTYGSSGSYPGLDRFGRVVDQKWRNDSAASCVAASRASRGRMRLNWDGYYYPAAIGRIHI